MIYFQEMFLALTFRPEDSHCIHVDAKADTKISEAAHEVVKCYNQVYPDSNVFLVDKPIPVYWGHISTLEVSFPPLAKIS